MTALLEQALRHVDDTKREKLLQEATEIAIGQQLGMIPMHYQVNIWAARRTLRSYPRVDELTHAADAGSVTEAPAAGALCAGRHR